jgi:uracil-DNA glycosylase
MTSIRIQPQRPIKPFCGLALIGESPGADEIAQGIPFVGKSGQLLNTVLEQVGIDREACLVTNVFLERPEGNKIDLFFRSANQDDADFITKYGYHRNRVVKDEYRLDMERLDAELIEYQPALILLLGATALWRINRESGITAALWRINRESGITAARGNWSLSQPYGGNRLVGIMPTWHPSAVLRNANDKLEEFCADISQVADALHVLESAEEAEAAEA